MTRQLRSFIGIAVFVVIVAVSGYALAASGNMSNPFNVITEISDLVGSGGESVQPGGERPIGEAPTGEGTRPVRGDAAGGAPGDQTSIQWDRLGSVLFNLWFIAAAAAVVMVVGRVVKGVSNLLQPRALPTLPTS